MSGTMEHLLRAIAATDRLIVSAASSVETFYCGDGDVKRFRRDSEDLPPAPEAEQRPEGGEGQEVDEAAPQRKATNFTTGGAAVAAALWDLDDELQYVEAVVSGADFGDLLDHRAEASAWLADPGNAFGFTGTFGDLNAYTTSLAGYQLGRAAPMSDRTAIFAAHLLNVYRKGWPTLRGVTTSHPYVAYHVQRAAETLLKNSLATVIERREQVDDVVDRGKVPKPECFKRDWHELCHNGLSDGRFDIVGAREEFLSSAKRYLWEQHAYAAPGSSSPHSLSYDPVGACFALNILVEASEQRSGWTETSLPEGPTRHLAEYEDLIQLTVRHVLGGMTPTGALAYGLPFSYIEKGMGAFATSISGLAALVRVLDRIFRRSRSTFYKNATFLTSLLESNAAGFERLFALPVATDGARLQKEDLTGWSTDRAPSFTRIESWVSMDVMLFAVHLRLLAQEVAQFEVVQKYGAVEVTNEPLWPYKPGDGFTPLEPEPKAKVFHDPDEPCDDAQEKAAWEQHAPAAVLHKSFGDLMGSQATGWKRDRPSSFLLFGPPGTSKSTLARSLAQALRWHYLELTPSNFVEQGLEMIERRSREIFEELAVLRETVVLFDELDSLLTDREQLAEGSILKFTVPAMLPKLQHLAKTAKRQRLLLIFATNYFDQLDAAMARRGRIDERLVVLPHNARARRTFFARAGVEGDALEKAVDETALGVFEDLDRYRRALETGGPPARPTAGVTPALYSSRLTDKDRATQRLALEVAEVVGRLLDEPRELDADDSPNQLAARLETLRSRLGEKWKEWGPLLDQIKAKLPA
ncbi:MAG: ATP-binding protein [Actinomycetota bacterium]|nr:ATP-binding protein [Actinomycetota bacterium]